MKDIKNKNLKEKVYHNLMDVVFSKVALDEVSNYADDQVCSGFEMELWKCLYSILRITRESIKDIE